VNPSEDDSFLQFSPDGAYFALEQTFTLTGAHLQVRKATTGGVVFSQASATMASWATAGSKLYFRHLQAGTIYAWDPAGKVTQPISQQLAWIKPRADAGDDYMAFTVRDAVGMPHVWLFGHGARIATQLPNVRSSPEFLTASQIFYIEEAPCGANCGPGPATLPDGRTFVYDVTSKVETASTIASIFATWPRPGQT